MKNFTACTILLALVVMVSSWDIEANPFASKIAKMTIREDRKKINLEFMGYAIMENQRFAIVQLDERQHILKKGESLAGIKIIRFSADSLYYQVGSIVYRVSINRGKQVADP